MLNIKENVRSGVSVTGSSKDFYDLKSTLSQTLWITLDFIHLDMDKVWSFHLNFFPRKWWVQPLSSTRYIQLRGLNFFNKLSEIFSIVFNLFLNDWYVLLYVGLTSPCIFETSQHWYGAITYLICSTCYGVLQNYI